jgi:general secretion pathway protein G
MSCNRNSRRRGFSLVEIMIVIVIIGLLAGVVTVNVRSYLAKAKQNTARQEIATIVHALEAFYTTYGRYPNNDEGITVLAEPTPKLPEPPLKGTPTDPWGNPYQYNAPGRSGPFEVICYGANGREGGEGVDQDISSDHLKE